MQLAGDTADSVPTPASPHVYQLPVSTNFSPGPHQQQGDGGPATWATTSAPNHMPMPTPGEVTPVPPMAMAQHGGWQFTDDKLMAHLVKSARHQGSPSMVGGIYAFHWVVAAIHNLGRTLIVGYHHATTCWLHRVPGVWGNQQAGCKTSTPSNNMIKTNRKVPLLIVSRNVRTMCPGYNSDPQSMTNLCKTAMIDKELGRLNIDVAAVQETRLPEDGSLHEHDYTFFWRGKGTEEAPTLTSSADEKDCFYDTLDGPIRSMPTNEGLYILGDFNAWVGSDHDAWPKSFGHHCMC